MKQFTALIFAVFFTFSTNALEIKGEFSGVTYDKYWTDLDAGQQVIGSIAVHLSPAITPSMGHSPSTMVMASDTLNWIEMSIQVGQSLFDFVLDPSGLFQDSIVLNNPMAPNGVPTLQINAAGGHLPFNAGQPFEAMEWAALTVVNWSDFFFGPNGMTCTESCGTGSFSQLGVIPNVATGYLAIPGFDMHVNTASFSIDTFVLGPVNPIPEPSTLLMFAFGVLGLTRLRKQR